MFKILLCDLDLQHYKDNTFSLYQVDIAYSANDILDLTYKNSYHLYIINFYFYESIKELKEFDDRVPTIFIDEYYNIINIKKAFDIGDDYMIKPINLEELKIRVDYQYKKIFNHLKNIFKYREFYYHISSKQLFLKNSKIKLSPNEIKIVELFLINLEKPVSKDTIFETINSTSDGTLRVYISKLKKLGFQLQYNRVTHSYTLITNY